VGKNNNIPCTPTVARYDIGLLGGWRPCSVGEQKANAALIVEAVNAHDRLSRMAAAGAESDRVLRRAIRWLGFLIAEGAHENSVHPTHAVDTLTQAEAAVTAFEEASNAASND